MEDLAEARAYFESNGVRVLGYSDEHLSFKHFYLHAKDTFDSLIQDFRGV